MPESNLLEQKVCKHGWAGAAGDFHYWDLRDLAAYRVYRLGQLLLGQ